MPWPSIKPVSGDLPKTQMGWEIFPDGLHHFLTRMARDYLRQYEALVQPSVLRCGVG
jgi:beta-glucosidase/6-phospho-beta-glucosidase/beta-galactosidase